jgi:HSP20 family protein
MNLVKYNPKKYLKSGSWSSPEFFRYWFDSDLFDGLWNSVLQTDTLLNTYQVKETGDEYLIRIEIPGFTKSQIKAEVIDRTLLIHADNTNQDIWDSKSTFDQKIILPDYINIEKSKAHLEDGVLFITAPKQKPETKPTKQIEIK